MSTEQLAASVIIPTYNRSQSLTRALRSLNELDFPRDQYEVVVVDNNSTDDTKQIAEAARSSMALNLKYVTEKRLSFTVARHTGANAAEGQILAYIDDDVVVSRGWLTAVMDVFEGNETVGIVGGPIHPIFEAEPPKWIKKCFPMSGALSLLDRGSELHETNSAYGPNFSVRKDVLRLVGGFPPDTLGVESEGRPNVVEKIYIGSGDVGLCGRVRKAGYKVIYAPQALVYHVIPPVRLTKKWWHSRFAGEACYKAITYQYEHGEKSAKLLLKSMHSLALAVRTAVFQTTNILRGNPKELYEFQISFYLSRAKTEFALARRPDLATRLWDAALIGVLPNDIDQIVRMLH